MKQLKITQQVTKRDISIDKYLKEISKYRLLTPEEEVELAQRIKQGDMVALERLVNSNLRFVVSVAKQYQNQGLPLSDLINEGNLGLIKAAIKFDETRGFKFISYAVWWIRQSILQALAEHSRIVRLPINKLNEINKINRVFQELEHKYEREPDLGEVSEAIEQSYEEIKKTLSFNTSYSSLDAPVSNDDENVKMVDRMPSEDGGRPDETLIKESLELEIKRILTTLSEKESNILIYYFGLFGEPAMSLEEISKKIGLTKERIRQIKETAIVKLKNSSRSKLLKKYL